MKKVIFTLFTICVFHIGANAQACGNSGSGVCNPSGLLTQPGLSPTPDSLPPVLNGVQANTVIQFKNYDTVTNSLGSFTIQSLAIDSIVNLPAGLCWATNKSNNQWGNQEDGCLKVTGLCCAQPGQYKLGIYVAANVGFVLHTNAEAVGLRYYVRVINCGDPEIALDTSNHNNFASTVAGGTYSATANCVCNTDLNDNDNAINTLSIVPNPFSNKALVSFFSEKTGSVIERITNIIGNEVYKNTIELKLGENTSTIEKGSLAAGVYFYSVDGKNPKRFIISE